MLATVAAPVLAPARHREGVGLSVLLLPCCSARAKDQVGEMTLFPTLPHEQASRLSVAKAGTAPTACSGQAQQEQAG